MNKIHFQIFTGIIVICLSALACSLGGSASNNQEATAEALAKSVAQTATAKVSSAVDSGDQLATQQAEATVAIQEIQSTQVAQEEEKSVSQNATAEAFSPIKNSLPNYGVDPAKGKPGWIHNPIELYVEGYQQFGHANDHPGVIAEDFVLSSDITWETQYGTAGCGFGIRSNGNQDELDQYMVLISRAGSGHAIFAIVEDGEIASGRDIYAYGIDPNFDFHNGSTNRLTIVARGSKMVIFTNDVLLSEFDVLDPPPKLALPAAPPIPADLSDPQIKKSYEDQLSQYNDVVTQMQAQNSQRLTSNKEVTEVFEKGFISMLAVNESGYTRCNFDNTWLWLIEE